MEKFKYNVILRVEVEAPDPADADEAVEDAFGLGDYYGAQVVECEIQSLGSAE